tara:strand:- start:538 stop:1617 length:1080 start_codon:yes stop_codon:yes gene_type:complete
MKNVQQVFVASDKEAAGVAVAAIAAGEFGVVDGATHQTVANISAVTGDYYYFGLGHADGTIVSDMFLTNNPGDNVACKVVNDAYTAGEDKAIAYTMGKVSCETEYLLKIRFEGEKIAKNYGYNDLVQTFSYTTKCCDPCSTACPTGGCADLAWGLAQAINAYDTSLIEAEVLDISTAGSPVTISSDAAAIAWDAAVTAGTESCDDLVLVIRGKSNASIPDPATCAPDAMAINQHIVDFTVGFAGGFDCNGHAVNTEDITGEVTDNATVLASGEAYQVTNLQAWAAGYKRTNGVYRIPFPYTTFSGNGTVVSATNYDIITAQICETYPGAATLNAVGNTQEIIVATATSGNAAGIAGLFA